MKVAVLPIYFNDADRMTAHTRAEIQAQFNAVAAYVEQQSGGRDSLAHSVFDWFRLPITAAEWAALEFEAGHTVVPQYQAGTGVDLSTFAHFVLLIDHADSRSGAWNPGGKYLHLSARDLNPALLAHEIGHLAGAGHSKLRTPFRDIEYGDGFCVMGGEDMKFVFADPLGSSGPGMAASTLRACGWLDFASAKVATDLAMGPWNSGEAVVDLAPLRGAPVPGSQGRPVVAFSDGLSPDHRLLIELRAVDGWDRGLPKQRVGWIAAHLSGPRAAKGSVLIGSIGANAGATLELPDAAVTLRVMSADPERVTLKLTRRVSNVFSGGGGVVYALNDTGDLRWFRHDGRNDGSFKWADSKARQVGVGWNFKHVFSGGDGVVYAINQANDLLWFRHDGRGDGSFKWADANARKVGVGWNFKHVFSGGDGVIYAINHADDLLWFRHDGRGDGSFKWADANARKVGVGWNFKCIFSGGDGVIYAINQANDLLWFRHDGRGDGSFKWADANARKVGTGWNVKHVFSGGDGLIYAINHADDLLWFRHDGRGDGSFRWADAKARKVGTGWNFKPRRSDGGVIYAINPANELAWFRHDGRDDGTFRWRHDQARVVGFGWDFRQFFTGDDSTIYGIDKAGNLRWFRHDGQVNGSFNWTEAKPGPDGTPQNCGVGWDFEHVFSGGNGVIYAINNANDLLWFRHDGRADGTFKWVDANARKVGTGWDVKHVFSGGDGVIYAINHAHDLLWFRHDGRGDGSFKWADAKARKVGTGWNFKHVFSGGDGVIYAVNQANDLLWFRHDGRGDGSFRWADAKARKVGTGWNFKHLIGT